MDLKIYNSSTSNKLFLFILTEIADSLFQSLFLRLDRGDMAHYESDLSKKCSFSKQIRLACLLG